MTLFQLNPNICTQAWPLIFASASGLRLCSHCDVLQHRWAISNPWAICGPLQRFQWPA